MRYYSDWLLSGLLGEWNSSPAPYLNDRGEYVKMKRCLVCGSEAVFLWLGGSIGSLYHCTDCQYVGPVVMETDARQPFADQFVSFWDLVEGGSF